MLALERPTGPQMELAISPEVNDFLAGSNFQGRQRHGKLPTAERNAGVGSERCGLCGRGFG
ncbi:MAG: hypothetical protein JNK90_28600 [Planctomycetaceae bacterium]|nr:hypothetical protein [Planctomycetaceae bacterium]